LPKSEFTLHLLRDIQKARHLSHQRITDTNNNDTGGFVTRSSLSSVVESYQINVVNLSGKTDTQNVSDHVLLVSIFFIPDASDFHVMLCWFCNLKIDAKSCIFRIPLMALEFKNLVSGQLS